MFHLDPLVQGDASNSKRSSENIHEFQVKSTGSEISARSDDVQHEEESAPSSSYHTQRNVVLDPANQQTRFYNLQAEATLSSLDSNTDVHVAKEQNIPDEHSKSEIQPHSIKQNVEDNRPILVQGLPNDGVEGDDEYEEDVEENDESKVKIQKQGQNKPFSALSLDLNLSEGKLDGKKGNTNEIIFSPGGNEFVVFAASSSDHSKLNPSDSTRFVAGSQTGNDENTKLPTTNIDVGTFQPASKNIDETLPKNIESFDIKAFSVRSTKKPARQPRGERPTTVGQSADSPIKGAKQKGRGTKLPRDTATNNTVLMTSPRKSTKDDHTQHSQMQNRHEYYKTILQASTTEDTDNFYSTEHSTDPSPRHMTELPYIQKRGKLLHINTDIPMPINEATASVSERDDDDATGM